MCNEIRTTVLHNSVTEEQYYVIVLYKNILRNSTQIREIHLMIAMHANQSGGKENTNFIG